MESVTLLPASGTVFAVADEEESSVAAVSELAKLMVSVRPLAGMPCEFKAATSTCTGTPTVALGGAAITSFVGTAGFTT